VLLLPVIPLCLTSIVAVAVMRLTNIGKRRDLFKIIGGVVALVLMLGLQTYIQSRAVNGDPEQISRLLYSENGLTGIVTRSFPPAAWISLALIESGTLSGFLNLLLFAGVSLAFIAAFSYLGGSLFLGGYQGSREVQRGGRRLEEGELSKRVESRSKVSAVFWREFRILNRVPVFFVNCVLLVILLPVIFLMMYFTMGNEALSDLQPL
jgi:ABC-2 type transport system permease protein